MKINPSKKFAVRYGFSLVEVAVSTLLVGVVLAGAMRMMSQSFSVRAKARDRERAMFLAHELAAEILTKAYEEPSAGGSILLGPDAGESSGAARTSFDDVDDFNGYVQSPCVRTDGTTIEGTYGWTQSVEVLRVSPSNPANVVNNDQGFKLIFVSVTTPTGFQGFSTVLRGKVDKQIP